MDINGYYSNLLASGFFVHLDPHRLVFTCPSIPRVPALSIVTSFVGSTKVGGILSPENKKTFDDPHKFRWPSHNWYLMQPLHEKKWNKKIETGSKVYKRYINHLRKSIKHYKTIYITIITSAASGNVRNAGTLRQPQTSPSRPSENPSGLPWALTRIKHQIQGLWPMVFFRQNVPKKQFWDINVVLPIKQWNPFCSWK